MSIAKVTSKGQMTLPADVRLDMGISPGDRVQLTKQSDGSYRLERLRDSFEDLRGIIKLDRPVSTEEIIGWVDEAREAIGRGDDRD